MLEQKVVDRVKQDLSSLDHYFVVQHGSYMTQTGTPDIISHDDSGILMGIECKVPGGILSIAQWRRCIEITRLRMCRFIIASHDFDILSIIKREIPVMTIKHDDDEFKLYERFIDEGGCKCTTEVIPE